MLKDETGGTIVEFACSLLLLLTTIFAILEFSLVLYANHFLSYTAQEAARYAMVRGSSWNNAPCTQSFTENCTASAADVANYVNSITPVGINPGDGLKVNTSWSGTTPTGASCSATNVTNSPGCVVQVQLSVSFSFFLPLLPNNTWNMSSTSAMVITR